MLTVSVVIPAFEAASFVGAAVRSACLQTLTDIEVLVIDDGSHDRTAEAAITAAGGDARVRVLRQPQNGGVSAARNAALDVARGRWIALLDADDVYAPERLARLVAAGDELGADLMADHVQLVREGSADEPMFVLPHRYARMPIDVCAFIRTDSPTQPIGFMKPLLRRSFLFDHALRYADGMNAGEDFHLYVRCLLRGARLYCARDAGYIATARSGSLSRADSSGVVAAFIRSTEQLREEALRFGNASAARLLARRALDQRSYGAYDRLSDALHRRRFRAALPMMWELGRRGYTWRRFATAARRRCLPQLP